MAMGFSHWQTNITLLDCNRNRSTLSYKLNPADFAFDATMASVLAKVGTIVAALEAVTNAEIEGYSVQYVQYEDTLVLPGFGVDNHDLALITVGLETFPKTATLKIPAPKSGIFTDNGVDVFGNQVDVTDAELRAYVGLFTDSGKITLSDGEHVAAGPAIREGRKASRVVKRSR